MSAAYALVLQCDTAQKFQNASDQKNTYQMYKEEFVAIYQLVTKTRQGAHGNRKVTLMEHQHVTADASNLLLGNQLILQNVSKKPNQCFHHFQPCVLHNAAQEHQSSPFVSFSDFSAGHDANWRVKAKVKMFNTHPVWWYE